MLDAFNTGDAVFDRLGDLRFQLRRRCAELRDRDRDHGDVGRGQPRHRELGETDPAERQKDDRKDDGRKRVADRPCGDIETYRGVAVDYISFKWLRAVELFFLSQKSSRLGLRDFKGEGFGPPKQFIRPLT